MDSDRRSDDFVGELGIRHKNRRAERRRRGRREKSKIHLGDGYFFVGAEGGTHGVADFAEGGVGFTAA